MSRIFIVRHGNTFERGEPARRIGARTDLPLTSSGVTQAEALGRWFAQRGIVFGRALAGDLRRTCQTATAILASTVRAPVLETAEWLTEIDHGPDENQPEDSVLRRIGAAAVEAWDREGIPPPGWQVDVQNRIGCWRTFLCSPPIADTLLVTSNGAARFALLAMPELAVPKSIKLRTGALAEIAFEPAGIRLISWDVRP